MLAAKGCMSVPRAARTREPEQRADLPQLPKLGMRRAIDGSCGNQLRIVQHSMFHVAAAMFRPYTGCLERAQQLGDGPPANVSGKCFCLLLIPLDPGACHGVLEVQRTD